MGSECKHELGFDFNGCCYECGWSKREGDAEQKIKELQAEVERLRSIAQRLANGQDGTECKNRAYADLVVYNLEKKAEEKEANDE